MIVTYVLGFYFMYLAFVYFWSYCIVDSENTRGDERINYICMYV